MCVYYTASEWERELACTIHNWLLHLLAQRNQVDGGVANWYFTSYVLLHTHTQTSIFCHKFATFATEFLTKIRLYTLVVLNIIHRTWVNTMLSMIFPSCPSICLESSNTCVIELSRKSIAHSCATHTDTDNQRVYHASIATLNISMKYQSQCAQSPSHSLIKSTNMSSNASRHTHTCFMCIMHVTEQVNIQRGASASIWKHVHVTLPTYNTQGEIQNIDDDAIDLASPPQINRARASQVYTLS